VIRPRSLKQANGATTLRALTAEPNERGIPTARNAGQWSAAQVGRVPARMWVDLSGNSKTGPGKTDAFEQ
jgi:hypothetical protein